jgi:hypothetical protein
MNSRRWMRIVTVAVATAGLTGTVMANEPTEISKGDHSSSDINSNSAAQLGPVESATQQRKGDSSAQRGSDNAAAQMGSSVNANPGAQLNNDTRATPAPPADADTNTAPQPVKTRAQAGPELHN